MSDVKVDRPTCKRIVVKTERDDDMDPMRANRDAGREIFTPEQIEDFEQDRWRYLGIYAVAEVHVPLGGATFIVEIPGPGLWGVESLSERSYLQEIATEQTGELRLVLDVLSIAHQDAVVELGPLA